MTAPDSTEITDPFAEKLRGFGPIGMLATVIIIGAAFLFVPLAAILVFIWRWRSGTAWEQIGYVAPKSTWVKS